MEAVHFSKMSANIYQATQSHAPESVTFHSQRRENLTSNKNLLSPSEATSSSATQEFRSISWARSVQSLPPVKMWSDKQSKYMKFGTNIDWKLAYKLVVQNAGWLDIHFTVGISCERAAPLAEQNAAARYHVLRSLISLHNEHAIYI
jgi:hypothetical protein